MAVTVKEITLWRREIENQPGTLATRARTTRQECC